MVIEANKLVDLERGLLDRSIFIDEAIYQEELEKVFGRAWLWIGHESLIPNPNDFFLTYMGEDPVILTRDAKGEVHAFLNMCRHRGNRVARADDGNAKNFMCTYHGWTYSNDGKLVSVPGLQEAYYGELDVGKLGLVSVAKLGIYGGNVFATWDGEACTLEEWLGDARYYLDVFFNRREGGVQLSGPDKWILSTNWKMPNDNFGTDNYHAGLTHRSMVVARAQRMGKEPPRLFENIERGEQNPMYTVRGHSVGGNFRPGGKDLNRSAYADQRPILGEYLEEIGPEVEERIGSFRHRQVSSTVNALFPNLAVFPGKTMIRLWNPRGPMSVEVWGFTVVDRDAPEDVKRAYRRESMLDFGIAGMQEVDDADNWAQCVQAGKSMTARRFPQNLSMGIGKEEDRGELPGIWHPNSINEYRQRGLYKRWKEFMEADSWASIPIHPQTAQYEGSTAPKT